MLISKMTDPIGHIGLAGVFLRLVYVELRLCV